MTKHEAADVLEHAIEAAMRATFIPGIVISVNMGDGDHMAWRWPGSVRGANADMLEDAEAFEDAAAELLGAATEIREGKTMQTAPNTVALGDREDAP